MEYIVKTDVGVVRSENQDRAGVFENKYGAILNILCDGMGGHMGGSYASKITLETFEDSFLYSFPKEHDISSINGWFTKTLSKAKKAMTKLAGKQKELMDMGTTLTMAIILKDRIQVYNIGDSRTYIYNGLLHQITEDHNVRNYYIHNLGYSVEEAAIIPQAASLTSAFGPTKKLNSISDYIINREKNMVVICTSDGIHDYIDKPIFESIISSNKSIDEKSTDLIAKAIKGKSSDNLTIAIVEVSSE